MSIGRHAPPLIETDLRLPGLRRKYRGKVRDVYILDDGRLVMVATDRTSAFDAPLTRPVPYKGEILNRISAHFLAMARRVVPVWWEAAPDPAASVGRYYRPVPVEFIVRGYLCGHALREYQAGRRTLAGQSLPDGLRPYQRLPKPILTPTVKAAHGHDDDIAPDEIIRRGILDESTWRHLEETALRLFELGSRYAAERGLILADTKYEFALDARHRPVLIDEVHTPDSSRYFYADDYRRAMQEGRPPQQLSKEFLRQWLLEEGIVEPGRHYDEIPVTPEIVEGLLARYLDLYERLIGRPFEFSDRSDLPRRIEQNIRHYLEHTASNASV